MGDSGGLTPGQRMDRVEEHQEASDATLERHVTNLWKEISAMKIEMARSQTKLAILVGILCFLGSVAAQLILKGVH